MWGNPGTRLGMWSHFTSQFSVTVFVLLWGYPFLVQGQGWSTGAAGTLLMAMTGWVVVSGLVLGALVARHPFYRSYIVIVVVLMMAAMWAVVLARSTPAPVWMIVVLAFATASGGPASMVGFDLARSFTPVEAVGRANGVVNVGGFLASLLTMGLVGVVLDLLEPGGAAAYDLDDFRVAPQRAVRLLDLRDRADPALPPQGAGPPRPGAPGCHRGDASRHPVRASRDRRP